jgi:hypothetical protein
MRMFLIILLCCIPAAATADQFNDLYYINPTGVPDLTEEGKQSENGPPPSPPSDGSSGSGSPGGEGSSSSDNGSSGSSGSSGGTPDASPGADGDSSSGSGAESEEDVLEELLEGGAVGGGGFSSKGAGGASNNVFIDGKKVRATTRADSDVSTVLRYWKLGKSKAKSAEGRLNPVEYYALIAATLASEDEALEGASFSPGRFEIVYRSRGALFWFIPMSFPVRLTITPEGEGARIEVRLPWYRFFVNEYFTPASLAGEVEVVVRDTLSMIPADETIEHVQAGLFEAVSQFLREKVRTINDSVLLQ